MKSVKEKIQDLAHLRTIQELKEWTDNFIENIEGRMIKNGWDTTVLSDKQVDKIDELWEKHCA